MTECTKPEKFKSHGGEQWRSSHYMVCGCDLAICEAHARWSMRANPFGPSYEEGKPRKCRKHREPAVAALPSEPNWKIK